MSNLAKSIKKCSGFCVPLIIYICFAVIGIIGNLLLFFIKEKDKNNKNNASMLIGVTTIQIISNIIIGALMYWLCSKCYSVISWIILLFPIIFGIILIAIMGVGFGLLFKKAKDKKKN